MALKVYKPMTPGLRGRVDLKRDVNIVKLILSVTNTVFPVLFAQLNMTRTEALILL